MEIMGLAIVVVLLLVGVIFAVKFTVLKNPSSFRKGFINAELASNTLNAFLNTNSKDCKNLAMKELISDCAKGATITCDDNSDSCAYVENAASEIFSSTLEKWNIKYNFLAFEQDNLDSPFIELGAKCSADKKSKTFLVPSKITVNVELDIC